MTDPNPSHAGLWLQSSLETAMSYRRMIDGILGQLSSEQVFVRPAAELNSVAVLLRHLGGNLKSRWTDFLTSDGEKPDRDREQEFADWEGDFESLVHYFDDGWQALINTLQSLDERSLDQTIQIRGESHTVPAAIQRSLTHISYHVGQMAIIARMVHQGKWKWMTVAPGDSQAFNQRTWGTSASRSVFAKPDDPNVGQ